MALAEADVHAIILGCDSDGVLAQLVERLNGIEEVRGSSPLGSTLFINQRITFRRSLTLNTHSQQIRTCASMSQNVLSY